jgi:hypothetical protein
MHAYTWGVECRSTADGLAKNRHDVTVKPMRIFTPVLLALLFTACVPAGPTRLTSKPLSRQPATPAIRKAAPIAPAAASLPSTLIQPPRVTTRSFAGITFEGVAFDSRSHRLMVADQAKGPSSQFADSAAAGQAFGGLAAVNAGFFTPEGQPLGRVVSAGKPLGTWNNASSLGSGLWFETALGSSAITRRGNVSGAVRELIQAGPLLIENSHSIAGLETTKVSARTVILWDGGTHWWIGCSSPCSLEALSQALASVQPAGWPVRHALNLDGGRSSDLWVSGNVAGGPILIRPPWNRPVRNFLVLLPR